MEIVCVQDYNDYGKIIHEKCQDYLNYLSCISFDYRNYIPPMRIKENGEFYYYYINDTLLTRQLSLCDNKRLYNGSIDTINEYYYYNNDKLLAEEINVPTYWIDTVKGINVDGGHLDSNGNPKDIITCGGFGDTTIYTYNQACQKVEMTCHEHNGSTITCYIYNSQGQLVYDSSSGHGGFGVYNYRYGAGYSRKYLYYEYGKCDYLFLSQSIFNSSNNEIETDWYAPDTVSYTFQQLLTDDSLKEWQLYRKILTTYDANGRISSTRFYVNDSLTTIHSFVYK